MLFRVGDLCDELHAVISGQVKLFALAPNGQEKVIELISPGQTFAEALMFTGRPYIVNAQALTETSLLTVKRIAIMREIENRPSLCAAHARGHFTQAARADPRRRVLLIAIGHTRDRIPAAWGNPNSALCIR